jgi:hypothetical protein
MSYRKSKNRLMSDLFGKAELFSFSNTSATGVSFDSSIAGVATSIDSVSNSVFQSFVSNTNLQIAGISGGLVWDGVTNFYSNTTPSVSANPTSNGGLWVDYTTGAIYVCRDNKTGNNVWTATIGTANTVAPTQPVPLFPGENYGYASGGQGYGTITNINKFPFASDANAVNIGNLTNNITPRRGTGASSETEGFHVGKYPIVDKWSFASDGNATNVGSFGIYRAAGQSSIGQGYGYMSGGEPNTSNVSKFSFSTYAKTAGIATLTSARGQVCGQSSNFYGYTSGGGSTIDKFPFVSEGTASLVGNLYTSAYEGGPNSSATHGYVAGTTPKSTTIHKFPFASDNNGSFVGNLTVSRGYSLAGASSTDYGYICGGYLPTYHNEIDKFSFASDADATDVGNLTTAGYGMVGNQY